MSAFFEAVKARLRPYYYAVTGKGGPTFTKHLSQCRGYQIGDWTYGSPIIRSWRRSVTLTIGKFCSIGGGVQIFLGGNHRHDWVTTYPFKNVFADLSLEEYEFEVTDGDVVIGNDVWIGHESLILSGVKIGNGSVIAARSVVTKDVPPYAIVAGNPARLIRFRFDDNVIVALQEIAWWDWPIERIRDVLPAMLSTDVRRFVEEHRRSGPR